MDLKGQYLSYKEYKELQGVLEEVPFNFLEYDVRKIIDERTQRRLIKLDEMPEDVKMCVFKMIETLEKYKPLEEQNKAISSENTDGYSISYRKLEKTDIDAKNDELEGIMCRYLSNVIVNKVPVLYLGVSNVS